MNKLNQLNNRYQALLGQKEKLKLDIIQIKQDIQSKKQQKETIGKAQEVIGILTDQARQKFKSKVDNLITLIIKSVFNEDFRFDLQMELGTGKLQCKPIIWEKINNKEYEFNPGDMGGSILDPISFAFRIVLRNFQDNKVRNVFILDEPMKNCGHGELLNQAANMFKEISHKLGIQLIIITHENELIDVADKSFLITRSKGISQERNYKEISNV